MVYATKSMFLIELNGNIPEQYITRKKYVKILQKSRTNHKEGKNNWRSVDTWNFLVLEFTWRLLC